MWLQSANIFRQVSVDMETSATNRTSTIYAKKKYAKTTTAERDTLEPASTSACMENANLQNVHIPTEKQQIPVK